MVVAFLPFDLAGNWYLCSIRVYTDSSKFGEARAGLRGIRRERSSRPARHSMQLRTIEEGPLWEPPQTAEFCTDASHKGCGYSVRRRSNGTPCSRILPGDATCEQPFDCTRPYRHQIGGNGYHTSWITTILYASGLAKLRWLLMDKHPQPHSCQGTMPTTPPVA